jgi:hypothetical protein
MGPQELPPHYTWTAARAAGLSPEQIGYDGERVTRGAYVSRAIPLSIREACVAAQAVLPPKAAFSHLTAAALFEAPVPHTWPLAVTVPPGVYRPRRQRMQVHVRDLLPGDTALLRGVTVTSGPQTWLDLSAVLPPEELVAVGDSLFRGGHLDADRLRARLERAAGTRGIAEARRCAAMLTPLAASRPESILRYWLLASDLPDPEPQVAILDRWGREVAHSDLGYATWKVSIEYEGRHHADPRQFGRDLERYSLMSSTGWLHLRFGARHLSKRETVIERVAGALRSQGATW